MAFSMKQLLTICFDLYISLRQTIVISPAGSPRDMNNTKEKKVWQNRS